MVGDELARSSQWQAPPASWRPLPGAYRQAQARAVFWGPARTRVLGRAVDGGSCTPLLQREGKHPFGWVGLGPASGLVKGGCRQSGNDDLEGFLEALGGLEENLCEKQSEEYARDKDQGRCKIYLAVALVALFFLAYEPRLMRPKIRPLWAFLFITIKARTART